jgi:hypothetical protein
VLTAITRRVNRNEPPRQDAKRPTAISSSRIINFDNSAKKAQYGKMVSLVERILSLHKQNPRTPRAM